MILRIIFRTHTHKILPEKYKYCCFKNFDLDSFLEEWMSANPGHP